MSGFCLVIRHFDYISRTRHFIFVQSHGVSEGELRKLGTSSLFHSFKCTSSFLLQLVLCSLDRRSFECLVSSLLRNQRPKLEVQIDTRDSYCAAKRSLQQSKMKLKTKLYHFEPWQNAVIVEEMFTWHPPSVISNLEIVSTYRTRFTHGKQFSINDDILNILLK
jgi:hypothetical protein